MLKLNISEEKRIDFEFELSGLSPRQIETRLRLNIDNIEYGFPAELKSESIHVSIPPLKSLINREFKDGETFNARLEVTGDGHFLVPWDDHFKVHSPIKMEAKVQDSDYYIEESDEPEIKVRVSESKPVKKSEKTNIKKSRLYEDAVGKKVKEALSKNKIKESKPIKKKSQIDFKNIKKEDIIKYISRVKTKNPQIQEIIYEQAVQAAGSGTPYKVFPEVMKILRRR